MIPKWLDAYDVTTSQGRGRIVAVAHDANKFRLLVAIAGKLITVDAAGVELVKRT